MADKLVTRRQFLKHAGATAALLGLSEAMAPQLAMVKVTEQMARRMEKSSENKNKRYSYWLPSA